MSAVNQELLDQVMSNAKKEKASIFTNKVSIVTLDDEDFGMHIEHHGKYKFLDASGNPKCVEELECIVLERRFQFAKFVDGGDSVFTLLESHAGGEFLDTAGTKKCGKITGEAVKELSKAERAENKKVKFKILLFILIKDGDDLIPAVITPSPSLTMTVGEGLDKAFKNLDACFCTTVVFGKTTKEKNGTISWFTYEVKKGSEVALTNSILTQVKQVQDYVAGENNRLLQKHMAALGGGHAGDEYADIDLGSEE